MLGLSRLLELAGTTPWRPNGRAVRRQPIRRTILDVGQLEERVVPTLLGQQLFPADYPWNQNISNAPVAANSAAIIAHIGTTIPVHPDWGSDSAANGDSPLYGIPFNVVHGNSTTKVNVVIDKYPGESDLVPAPIPANAVLEGDYQDGPNPNGPGYNANQRGDSHLIVWDEDNNIAYEFFFASRPSENTDGQWHAAAESVWYMNTNAFRSLGDTSADAAGLSILAGLARPDEGLPTAEGGQGAIDHALRFTLPAGNVASQYVYPASHVVSASSGPNDLPLGSRLRLMNTPAVDAIIDTLGPEAQILAQAMQQYGLVLADIGSAMFVTGASASVDANNQIDFTWDMDDVLGLSALNAGDFQVVDLTPVVTGLSATSGAAGTTLTITGQNFSGSAGHLQVFFGGTAATSVTYVDDAHLIVTVPNGSGAVQVTVQSGLNELDPNNANDNVNNPVFGYGVSATSAADQFTYPGVVVGQFGGQGVWQYNRSGGVWTHLTAANATLLAADPLGDVAAEFPGQGVWEYTNAAGWRQVNGIDATLLVMDAHGDVVAEFPGYGVGEYVPASGWRSLTGANAALLAVDANGDVAGAFPGAGVWEFTASSGWKQINGVDVTLLAMDAAGDIVANFPGFGVGEYQTASGWKLINGIQASALAIDQNGNVAAEFAGYGVGEYLPGSGWRTLTGANAALLGADIGDMFGAFAGAGVWEFDPTRGWFQLTAADALALVVG